MAGGLIADVFTPHTPRMAIEEQAPDFVRPLISGARALGDWIRGLQPDCVVVQSTHWVSTFNWYVTAQSIHQGYCVADEAPDMIPGLPYRYNGDPDFAREIADAAQTAGLPFRLNTSEHYQWDYGTCVPLRYIDPQATLNIVTLPTVILADLDECMTVGRLVDSAARASGKRVVFIASSALTHALVRGPERWPEKAMQELDFKFIDLIERGAVAEAIDWFPEYARDSVGEMGGRVLAGFMGALDVLGAMPFTVRRFGEYAQSSGSGNLSLACSPAAYSEAH